ncbi:TPA: PIN domain nuclease [candidate division CPR2 bacterium]|uniref:PilT protein domain protein n=1 Tax=candidate division CPR2 bacterium GW2011_GWC1_41_48 TaxID=1618344 RepID=A0A0G0W765_UNCC2|nr:MAG: PilT protein domain protein [candidate division CPR2 bacterium GW2011_GWC2_39_35]KKR27114.1 MAG: PilT protein domain protein [candidate division CPR2 bacterium GW2011_GWD1_39_7]KKR28662.1 MAG: PilT protein domain protein [candidate division CPR2 bacterium GW2011_GWD2_39_7]KKS08805.1 MAG: PilT protein domain protein [candidate division CPR2 bacterium GW2011_GWC1_41_48]OGB56882.1 MAG: hypothetical protein A2Y27_01860 [candidate division CPR2 bacterium GWD1_39_7]OGB72965.1 MAG: hypothetic
MSMLNVLILSLVSIIIGGLTFVLIKKLLKTSSKSVFIGLFGVLIGLIIGALLSLPLSRIPGFFGYWLPIIISLVAVASSVYIVLNQKEAIISAFSGLGSLLSLVKPSQHLHNEILVDTSVLIDGRFIDIAKSGFVFGKILVPHFVIQELQLIADKGDKLKRERGRRGLESLNVLKNKLKLKVEIIEDDTTKAKDVDSKLVEIAKKRGSDIITTDYNLNRVAKIHGVKVLNINELSNAVKAVFIPGEEMKIKVVQLGKEKGQGVGYLPDGTMIVVEGGDKMVGQEVTAEVSRIFQTIAGKMIFAIPIGSNKQRTKNKNTNERFKNNS